MITDKQLTKQQKYAQCELMPLVQHIDIFGRERRMSCEKYRHLHVDLPVSVTAVALAPASSAGYQEGRSARHQEARTAGMLQKLQTFSVVKRHSSCCPARDFRRAKTKFNKTDNNMPVASVVIN